MKVRGSVLATFSMASELVQRPADSRRKAMRGNVRRRGTDDFGSRRRPAITGPRSITAGGTARTRLLLLASSYHHFVIGPAGSCADIVSLSRIQKSVVCSARHVSGHCYLLMANLLAVRSIKRKTGEKNSSALAKCQLEPPVTAGYLWASVRQQVLSVVVHTSAHTMRADARGISTQKHNAGRRVCVVTDFFVSTPARFAACYHRRKLVICDAEKLYGTPTRSNAM